MYDPVIKACSHVLIHTPSFVRYGSKPSREIDDSTTPVLPAIETHLRSFEEAVEYPPNQVFIGNLHPDRLNGIEQPWYRHPVEDASRYGAYGEIMPEEEFLGLMKLADDFDLMWIEKESAPMIKKSLQAHPFWNNSDLGKIDAAVEMARIHDKIENQGSLPLYCHGRIVGCMHRHHEKDDALKAQVLMENLMAKASGALALTHLLKKSDIRADEIDLLLNCSEEAVGDRYNRGGGGLAKAIGEMCGCVSATGCDIKAFCVGPIYALVHAAGLVKSGLFNKVVVVGGGSMAKLGMKFKGHLAKGMPILEDVLGGLAFLVTGDDGESPSIRMDSIGKHDIGSGSSQQNIMESLVLKPLDRMGKKITDVDRYAVELQNPEVTVPAGSGNVPLTNYRMIGALAVLRREMNREGIDRFVLEHGMPGFSPTQGHIPAAVPFLGHAIDAIKRGEMNNAMFVARGSLFLGRMTQLSDGLSFLIEKNPGRKAPN
ncbi:MAG: Glycine/sarcosine/betaine reductase complex component C subunit beta [Syntrophorhabdus sp. PtaB.Bin006]|nr:MAG: Glycine/sarcosine/betaine reductase complex component C subunit beta [Syntrophorhabdus sp. PtaB.Bin006]